MSALLPSTSTGASSGAELVSVDGRTLPLVSTTLHAEASGGIARYVLEQTFRNQYDETLHVTYRMPLPADGAVSGYAFEIGGRTITGVVDRKAAARERFEQAIVSGKTAALLEQDRADIFTQQLGNIPANETIIARITVDQRLAWLPEGEWELRFPTVIGPRYIGSADTAADVHATHVKVGDTPLAVTVQLALTIKDAITGGRKASSPTHTLARREGGGINGVLELGVGARLDRDIVVRWPVASPEVGIAIATARPADEDVGANAFGLLTIVPPARAAKQTPVARDLLVLLDTSGSMGGGPLDKAKQVVAMILDSLAEHDRFELIEFSNQPSRYKAEPELATAKAKQAAIKWVRSRQADGGTEMRAAVIEALCTLRIGAQRQVVLVTDGYVGGEQQILDVLHARLPRSCRLHVLGVGSAVNRALATSLARAGRGAEVIVGIDEDAERGAKRLLDRTRMPMLTNVEIMGSALVAHAPEHVPDVFEGAPLVAALMLRPEGGEIVVRGELARDSWEQRITIAPQRLGDGNQAIVALYGRERVADLESRTMIDQVNTDIEQVGLRFQIATRFTSWVAVDESRVIAKGPTRNENVPQELPYGTSAAAFGLRSAPARSGATRTMAGTITPGGEKLLQELMARSISPARDAGVFEDDGDFGEEAPAEVEWSRDATRAPRPTESSPIPSWDEEEATGSRGAYAPSAPSAPPPPAPAPRSLPPMSSRATRPPQSMPGMAPMKSHSVPRAPSEPEGATGGGAPGASPPAGSPPVPAQPGYPPAPAQAGSLPEPAQPGSPSGPAQPQPAAKKEAAAVEREQERALADAKQERKRVTGAERAQQPAQLERKRMKMPEAPVAPAKQAMSWWATLLQWLGMIALATAIALLVWWLLS